MKASICIVGGCGHVGLPLGIAFARAGGEVSLFDTDRSRVQEVNAGRLPFLERGAEEPLRAALATGRLRAITSPEAISKHDAVILTIGTPVDEYLDPALASFEQSTEAVLDQMRDGQLLILRSTVFPGVTNRLGRRVRDRGQQIEVAHCPERIAEGYALEELGKIPQIVGGVTREATRRATVLFRLLGAKAIELPPIEAEFAKLFTNAYRYINFAISNQFYMIAEKWGVDFHRVHEAVTMEYPRTAGFAKAGLAAGPCLLKDTMQLAAFNHNAFAIGQAAMMVNEGLPSVLVDTVRAQHHLRDATAAILGMAFKGNCDDPRASLSYKLRKLLTLECRRVLCTDPYIQDPRFVPLETALAEADIIFIGACHDEYRDLAIDKPVVDVFGFLQRGVHENLGDRRRRVHRRLSGRRPARAGARGRRSRQLLEVR